MTLEGSAEAGKHHGKKPAVASAAGHGAVPQRALERNASPERGPSLAGGQVAGGFVRGNQLVVAVELEGDEYGGVFGIDLSTGARTLLSGKHRDRGSSDVSKGAGKGLDQVRDVAPGPDNTWIAFAAQGATGPRTLVSIRPETGDRTVIFDAARTTCAGIAGEIAFDARAGIAVGPDGSIYLGQESAAGKGIVRVVGGRCNVVTLSGAARAADNRGSGPIVNGPVHDLAFQNGKLWLHQGSPHASVLAVEPATGDRMMISVSPDRGTGPDVASESIAVAPDGVIWTYHGRRGGTYGLVSIDPTTGNRSQHEPRGGPARKTRGLERAIWIHPDGKRLLLHDGGAGAILSFDPSTGSSEALSY